MALTSFNAPPSSPQPLGPIPAGHWRVVLTCAMALPECRGDRNSILDLPAAVADHMITMGNAVRFEDVSEPEPEVEEVARPYTNASKADWIKYAVSQGADKLEAMTKTKAQLQNEHGERL
jgi:hypothetical protein